MGGYGLEDKEDTFRDPEGTLTGAEQAQRQKEEKV